MRRDCSLRSWPVTYQQGPMRGEPQFSQGSAPTGSGGLVNPYARCYGCPENPGGKGHYPVITREVEIAFNTIKQELQSAPALALPDYEKDFHLYVSNQQEGYVAAVLTQETGTGKAKQPIAYYSAKLDEVAQGYPPCYQGLVALYYAYEKASSVTMGYPVILYTHHKVTELLERGKTERARDRAKGRTNQARRSELQYPLRFSKKVERTKKERAFYGNQGVTHRSSSRGTLHLVPSRSLHQSSPAGTARCGARETIPPATRTFLGYAQPELLRVSSIFCFHNSYGLR
ncbi:uncharacterized protein [Mobula birostris]|uniref:uncharacterized protein n=1 Tax=Mobula birostris TaxID=1983395 RepID=UPI003B27FD5E